MSAIPRRRFLASSSAAAAPWLGAGAAQANLAVADAAAPGQAPATRANSAWQLLALAPQSHKIPTLASDYRRGVELGLAQHPQLPVQLHWIEAAPTPSAASRAVAAELQRRPGLHGVLGWLSPEHERRIATLAAEHGLPLWVSDSGADQRASAPTDTTARAQVFHSLELCAQAQQLAQQVLQQHGKRVLLAMGAMESGYDFVVAFEKTFRALGGQVAARHVGTVVAKEHEFRGLRTALHGNRPDAVVALYTGPQMQRFTQWWAQHAQGLGPWALAIAPWVDITGRLLPPSTAQHRWRPRFEAAQLAWSAPALLGAEAGFSLGATLAVPAATSPSATSLQRAWRKVDWVGPLGQASAPPSLSLQRHGLASAMLQAAGGWTNGYWQT